MELVVTVWGTIAALILFSVIGLVLFVRALRPDPAERAARPDSQTRRRGVREAMRRYVGPIDPDTAILSPVRRVLLELVAALCGFPGFGWLMSTRVSIGLPLLCVGPAVVYGFYPVYLAMTGHLNDSPFIAIRYLPFLALISSSALAAVEIRTARRRHLVR